jgi:hypothetical protein
MKNQCFGGIYLKKYSIEIQLFVGGGTTFCLFFLVSIWKRCIFALEFEQRIRPLE